MDVVTRTLRKAHGYEMISTADVTGNNAAMLCQVVADILSDMLVVPGRSFVCWLVEAVVNWFLET